MNDGPRYVSSSSRSPTSCMKSRSGGRVRHMMSRVTERSRRSTSSDGADSRQLIRSPSWKLTKWHDKTSPHCGLQIKLAKFKGIF